MSGRQIIGVHGLANKPPKDVLAGYWHKSMLEGLRKNSRISRGDLPFTSVYWANEMYDVPDEEYPKYKVAAKGALKSYEAGVLDNLRAEALDIGGDALDWLKKHFNFDALADGVLAAKLQDLSRYYEDAAIRETLRARLRDTLLRHQNESVMLICHSMGTIIAYDVLRQLGRDNAAFRIAHLITIGSPLGMPHVRHKILEEWGMARTPSNVDRWDNLADKRDPVAIDVYLNGDYKANGRGVEVRDDLILNDWGGINHKSYGYLRCPEMSALLAAFI